MLRKCTTLAAALAVVAAFTLSGYTSAADDEGPLAKLMEKVNRQNLAITKGVRTAVAYKKDQQKVAEAAADLAKLGRESRPFTEPAKEQKKPQAEWEKLMDEYIAECEKMAELVKKTSTTQAEAKAAHNKVKATCTNCHNVFRVEEDK